MNTLERICADKRAHVAATRARISLREVEAKIKAMPPPRGFLRRLRAVAQTRTPAIIAEFKRASPSKGLIRPGAEPTDIAKAYAQAGAACLSVLTDTPYFQGSDADFETIRATCALPMIRKDFMVDPYQIYESRAMGADCVLLILAALEDGLARDLFDLARTLGMDVLAEVHDAQELERAMDLGADLVGINSRNLKTLQVDLDIAVSLAARLSPDVFRVAESGIETRSDLLKLRHAGFQGYLIGESLMRAEDVGAALRVLTDPVQN